MDGRAESAHLLRQTPATVNIAHDSIVFPHLHVPEDIVELFQEAIAEPARNGESDEAPAEEFGDPAIVARREAHRRRLTATRAGRPRAPAPHEAHTTRATRATQQQELNSCYIMSSGDSGHRAEEDAVIPIALYHEPDVTIAITAEKFAAASIEQLLSREFHHRMYHSFATAREGRRGAGGLRRHTIGTSSRLFRAIVGLSGECSGVVFIRCLDKCC